MEIILQPGTGPAFLDDDAAPTASPPRRGVCARHIVESGADVLRLFAAMEARRLESERRAETQVRSEPLVERVEVPLPPRRRRVVLSG